ncbi:MAG: DUF3617 domain-containing protein [Burkholderiaceae bacterium]|jgi:hypothetical protein
MRKFIAFLLLAGAVTLAQGEPRKAGLWEQTMTINFTQGGPQIPPEQLEKMKQMGIQLPFGRPMVNKVCVTPEMAARNEPPRTMREQDQCHMSGFDMSANPISAEMVCEGDTKGKGTLKVSHDAESYKGMMEFTGTDKRGTPIAMQGNFAGRWLGADCGDVKPPPSAK